MAICIVGRFNNFNITNSSSDTLTLPLIHNMTVRLTALGLYKDYVESMHMWASSW